MMEEESVDMKCDSEKWESAKREDAREVRQNEEEKHRGRCERSQAK